MRRVKWLLMVSIFVVGVIVFEIIINLKQQKQNDIAEGSNDVFATLQNAVGNEVEDKMYQCDEFLKIEMKKVSKDAEEIDLVPFEELAEKYEKKKLYSEDFQVEYEGITIGKDTTEEQIINHLGYPERFESSNRGFISGGNGYRRWQLEYPDDDYPDKDYSDKKDDRRYLRIVLLSELGGYDEEGMRLEKGSYLVFIELGHNMETARGTKRGDTIESMLEAYGSPDIIQVYDSNNSFAEFIYGTEDDVSLRFVIDETMKIWNIQIDINMEKSIIDQGL